MIERVNKKEWFKTVRRRVFLWPFGISSSCSVCFAPPFKERSCNNQTHIDIVCLAQNRFESAITAVCYNCLVWKGTLNSGSQQKGRLGNSSTLMLIMLHHNETQQSYVRDWWWWWWWWWWWTLTEFTEYLTHDSAQVLMCCLTIANWSHF